MDPMEGNAALYGVVLNNFQDAEEQEYHPPRQMHRALDPFGLDERQFIKLYRLSKALTRDLIDMLAPHLQAPTRRSAVSINIKVLVTLRFYATGSYQDIAGNELYAAISQPSVSRSIAEVTEALNYENILNEWVKFPNNIEEMENLRRRFYVKYQLPGVVGIIDCTHVAIVAPTGEEYPEYAYVNRKNYHSINVQLICDENLKILNVNARFPGSVNDIHIWKQSNISRLMERLYRENPNNLFYLLGDSEFFIVSRPWLLTPLDRPAMTAAENRFDSRLKTVRSDIERCNGVLKNRFRCLLKHRVLHYKPRKASKIINACVVLHNMCTEANILEPEIEDGVEVDFGMYPDPFREPIQQNVVNPDLTMARNIQRQIATAHFNE